MASVIAMRDRNDERLYRRWAGYVPDYASRQVISGGVLYLGLSKESRRGKKDKSSTCEALPGRSELMAP